MSVARGMTSDCVLVALRWQVDYGMESLAGKEQDQSGSWEGFAHVAQVEVTVGESSRGCHQQYYYAADAEGWQTEAA